MPGNHRDPRFGLEGGAPPMQDRWEQLLSAAPRSITYTDAAGQLVLTNAAVQTGANRLYAYVDPWAGELYLTLPQQVFSARDLYADKKLQVESSANGSRIHIEAAPAVVELVLTDSATKPNAP